ncbi:low molecular weight protein-tyrosine-phosphatase [Ancylomarina longa]|uniref:Low molecular weight phosphotyrosine protein phosphatase n=1 Tax=Ancylomarina longa TaxID=2487017 RepID=A0A434AX22_9BACT|nr:low molecular weight protein-tyrosine-phosphatase [Ancylomarina longa]RUT79063.1 low molecular weight phosphotyrosine protein phosphatase [Ancylomarina longa]
MKKKLLFVCLGNICRSPSAEAVMKKYLKLNHLESDFLCDSAGTAAYHIGERADARMRNHALKRDFQINSIARQFNPQIDFDKFDFIIGMDQQNISDIKKLVRNSDDLKKISAMTDYCTEFINYNYVPDPYYGGENGFELVLDILEDACLGLINQISR